MAIKIVVHFKDESHSVFDVTGIGWRINPAQRCLIIGHGVPRTHIPLDNVKLFEVTNDAL